MVDSDKDNGGDPNGEDSVTSFFDTTTNLWSDAFLAGRGGDFDDDDNVNNDGRGEGLF